jgi:cytochrome b subunit of formate dehydrogenase
VVVLAGHVFLAVIYPSTRPAPRGMLTGWVDRRWAQRHHPGWLAELDARRAE